MSCEYRTHRYVSIPSRGFWFFEGTNRTPHRQRGCAGGFQSPRGDFGFLKFAFTTTMALRVILRFNPLAGILVF